MPWSSLLLRVTQDERGGVTHDEHAEPDIPGSRVADGAHSGGGMLMAFGLVCIGSDRGLIPHMLGEGRGVVVPPGDVGPHTEDLVRRIRARIAGA